MSAAMVGGPADAAAGGPGFYLGRHPATITQVAPLLNAIEDADRFLHCGTGIGGGYTSKLIAIVLWSGRVAARSEMLLFGQRSGLNLDTLHRVLKDSPVGSVFLTQHAGDRLAGDYLPSTPEPVLGKKVKRISPRLGHTKFRTDTLSAAPTYLKS